MKPVDILSGNMYHIRVLNQSVLLKEFKFLPKKIKKTPVTCPMSRFFFTGLWKSVSREYSKLGLDGSSEAD